MTVEEAVADGAKRFAIAEEALAALSAALPGIITTVRDGGHIGAIECMIQISNGLVSVNKALDTVVHLHKNYTDRCIELGIDLPQPRSGGR